MKFFENFRVNSHDVDACGVLRPSAMLKYMQESANLQCMQDGPSNDELRARGYGFVVSRMSVSVYEQLGAYDEISVASWPCESKGFTFVRCYEVRKGDMLIAEAYSTWALLNLNTRRPCRVTEIAEGYLTGEFEPVVELDTPARIKMPDNSDMALCGEYTVSYRDIDVNRHMNNTVYLDLICGFLPMEKKKVISFLISYQNEAPLGETLKIYTSSAEEGTYFIRTVRGDGKINVEAEIMLEDI